MHCLLSHFLFTNLLLPKLRLTVNAQPTVVNTSSAGHRMFPGNFDDANWQKRNYNIWIAYGSGKAANVVFSKALRKRGIQSVAVHPGRTWIVIVIRTLFSYFFHWQLFPGPTSQLTWESAPLLHLLRELCPF